MKCRDVEWMLSLYDSGELSPEEQKIAETHLASCEKCRQELAHISGVPALIVSPWRYLVGRCQFIGKGANRCFRQRRWSTGNETNQGR